MIPAAQCDECGETAVFEVKYHVLVSDLGDGDRDGTTETIHACKVEHAGVVLASRSGRWLLNRFSAKGAGKIAAKKGAGGKKA